VADDAEPTGSSRQREQVHVLDQQAPARPQGPAEAGQHPPVRLVVEVAERVVPADQAVEPVGPWQPAHVALEVLDVDPHLGRVPARPLEVQPAGLQPRDSAAPRG
jgi:hypothetical protein